MRFLILAGPETSTLAEETNAVALKLAAEDGETLLGYVDGTEREAEEAYDFWLFGDTIIECVW